MNNYNSRWGKKEDPAEDNPVNEVTLLALVVGVMSAVVNEADKLGELDSIPVEHSTSREAMSLLPSPSRELTPEQVVKIQLSALKLNDLAGSDAGIAKVYEFASHANREMTSTSENFRNLLRSPVYNPLLGFSTVDFDHLRQFGESAEQAVVVTPAKGGAPVRYTFLLEREMFGELAGCWLVDGIARG